CPPAPPLFPYTTLFRSLRAGYGQGNVDPKFGRNASECERLGIPFGIYWFSYAYTPEMAAKEALYALEAVRPYKMDYPLAFDYERSEEHTSELQSRFDLV